MTAITQSALDFDAIPGGWSTTNDLQALVNFAAGTLEQGDTVVMIGAFIGRVPVALSQGTSKQVDIVCVDGVDDPYANSEHPFNFNSMVSDNMFDPLTFINQQFVANTASHSNISLVHEWYPNVAVPEGDLVFINIGVNFDLDLVLTSIVDHNLKTGGTISGFHYADYAPTVKAAVDAFVSANDLTLVLVPGSTLWAVTL